MRRAPESTVMDNPLLGERIQHKESLAKGSEYKVPQDIILERKHQKQMDDIKAASKKKKEEKVRPSTSQEDYYPRRSDPERRSKPVKTETNLHRENSNDFPRDNSRERLSKDRSNEDLSSQSKTHKRMWKVDSKPENEPLHPSSFPPEVKEEPAPTSKMGSNMSSLSPGREDRAGKKPLFGKGGVNPFSKKSNNSLSKPRK